MPKNIIQISQLIVEPRKKKEILEIFVSSPSYQEEQHLGRLFGILHCGNTEPDSYAVINTILKEIERKYYHGIAAEPRVDISIKLENALGKLNEILLDEINKENLSLELDGLSFIIGVIKDQSLHFCHHGKIKNFLFHKANGTYQVIGITETAKEPIPSASARKIFTNIISGKIQNQDAILFSTESLIDYLSLDKLKQTIITNSATSAASHLKNLLQEINLPVFFGAILIRLAPLTIKQPIETRKIPLQMPSSLSLNEETRKKTYDDIIKIEQKTETLLSPSALLTIKKYWAQGVHSIASLFKLRRKSAPPILNRSSFRRTSPIKKHSARRILKILSPVIIILLAPYFFAKKTLLSMREKKTAPSKKIKTSMILGETELTEKISAEPDQIQEEEKGTAFSNVSLKKRSANFEPIVKKIAMMFYSIQQFSKGKKILLLVSVILLFVFFESLIIFEKRQNTRQETAKFQSAKEEIQTLFDEVEASLIYEDETRAKESLLRAKEQLVALQNLTKEQQGEKDEFQKRIEEKLRELRHEQIVQKITTIAALPEEFKNPQQIIALNSQIYVFNRNAVQRFDRKTNKFLDTLTLPESNTLLQTGKLGNSLLLLSQSKKLFLVENGKLSEKALALDIKDITPSDIFGYSNRIYILDSEKSQIYRLNRTENGFSNGSAWFAGKEDVSTALSFAIDGNIYVLLSNGEVKKYYGGKPAEFEKAGVDPLYQAPKKIVAGLDTNFLYILEPALQRIVVLEKNGKYLTQYISETFSQLIDIEVREKEKTMYLLYPDKIASIPLTHVK